MKLFSSLLVLIALSENISCFSIDESNSGESLFTPEAVIHLLSEQIRYLIKSGDEDNGVPVLDPYEFQTAQFNFIGEIFNANFSITNGKITGLGNYQLMQINFSKSEIAIEFEIKIPYVKFDAEHYKLLGNLYDAVPIKGQGLVNIEVHNTTLWGKLYLEQSADGKAILLDKIENPNFSIQRITSRTQFDNNIDSIISAMVEDLLADYLTRFSKYIAATYSDSLVRHLNKFCEKYDTWDLIAVILSSIRK